MGDSYRFAINKRFQFFEQPWTEYKRRFWKNALGDEYESPSQSYNTTIYTQASDATQAPEPSTSRKLTFDNSAAETDADKNIQKLADLIKNRGKESPIAAAVPVVPVAKQMTETGENQFERLR